MSTTGQLSSSSSDGHMILMYVLRPYCSRVILKFQLWLWMYQFLYDEDEEGCCQWWRHTYKIGLSTAVHVSCIWNISHVQFLKNGKNLFGLSYACMSLTIGKSLYLPMLYSNGRSLTLITSKIDSINACLLTQLMSAWESIMVKSVCSARDSGWGSLGYWG